MQFNGGWASAAHEERERPFLGRKERRGDCCTGVGEEEKAVHEGEKRRWLYMKERRWLYTKERRGDGGAGVGEEENAVHEGSGVRGRRGGQEGGRRRFKWVSELGTRAAEPVKEMPDGQLRRILLLLYPPTLPPPAPPQPFLH